MLQTRPASGARRAPNSSASLATDTHDDRRVSSTGTVTPAATGTLPRSEPKPKVKRPTSTAFVGAASGSEGPWERTLNCEDSDKDLRDFWALILEGSERTKQPVPVLCAPFIALDAKGKPPYITSNQHYSLLSRRKRMPKVNPCSPCFINHRTRKLAHRVHLERGEIPKV
jgi:hypothetical protein